MPFKSKDVQRAYKKILKEIEKCDLVCSNCHAIRTEERRRKKREESKLE